MLEQRRSMAVHVIVSILFANGFQESYSLMAPSSTIQLARHSFDRSWDDHRGRKANVAFPKFPSFGTSMRPFYDSSDERIVESKQEQQLHESTLSELPHSSKLIDLLNCFGFSFKRRQKHPIADLLHDPIEVTTIHDLEDYFNDVQHRFSNGQGWSRDSRQHDTINYNTLLASLSVRGDTQIIGSSSHKDLVHPVVQLLHDRRRQIENIKYSQLDANQSTQLESSTVASSERDTLAQHNLNFDSDNRTSSSKEDTTVTFHNARNIQRVMPPKDGCRIALAIEGGGMRGCVTAGMVAAIYHLGLEDTIDVVYGSSAGTVIGAYFIARQLPWFGPEVYYDALTTAGSRFINTKRFLRAAGWGLLDPRLIKDVIFRRNHGKPVLDLTYLLTTTMQENKPLDWETFEEMQKAQPLKVIASGLKSQKAIVMDMERGSFRNIKDLANCMRASCLLPGVAGPIMNLRAVKVNDTVVEYQILPRNRINGEEYEPMADALLFEPLPFRSALDEGATHVICLRSRPDGVDVTGKSSFIERLIVRRFFLRKNSLRNAYQYMRKHFHKKRYAEDIICLNEAAHDMGRPYSDTSKPHLLAIAVPPGSPEVTRLETDRKVIFEGVRRGFARAYDALVDDVEQRGKGVEKAKEIFPDDILDHGIHLIIRICL